MASKIYADVQTLSPGDEVVLFELDATRLGGDVAYFHGHNQGEPIWWQGNEYTPWPIEAEGFEVTGEESQPRPSLRVADVDRHISQLCEAFDDLAGAKVTRLRTLVRFLDERNFKDGNPDADPGEHFPPESFYIEMKTEAVAGEYVSFELVTVFELSGSYIPSRQITATYCQWIVIGGYRGPNCGWTGPAYDKDDNPTSDPSLDVCSGQLSGCRARFGRDNPMPFGGFPTTNRARV